MAERLNVLWIQTDELRADAVTPYPSPWAPQQTPHLARLAAEGVTWTECHCNSPVCVASRTSMLSGLYPHELGVYHNEANINGHRLPDDLVSWPQALAAAGYRTCTVGKTHTPRRHPFWQEVIPAPPGSAGGYAAIREPEQAVRLAGPLKVLLAGIYPVEPGGFTPTEALGRRAADWLTEAAASSQPWLLRASFLMPHTPVLPPRRLAEQFSLEQFPIDPVADRADERMSPFEQFVSSAQGAALMTPEQIAWCRLCYWAAVSDVDEQVGRLVARLDELGLRERTVVVFDSDHGAGLGDLGLWQKQTFTPAASRVPQILSCPGRLPAGEIHDELCDLLDRGPTLLDLCGVDRVPGARGRNLFEPSEPEPEMVFSIIGYGNPGSLLYPLPKQGPETPRRACVRTRRYRYERNVRVGGEDLLPGDPRREPCLIDRHGDPTERTNHVGEAVTAGVAAWLAAALDDWLALDAGINEPPLEAWTRAGN